MPAAFNTAFYETLATVIPVLVALLFFEGRYRSAERESGIQMYFALAGVSLLVVTEANALWALYDRDSFGSVQLRVLVAALVFGLGSILLGAVVERLVRLPRRTALAVWFWLVVGGVVVALLWGLTDIRPLTALSYGALYFWLAYVPIYQLVQVRKADAEIKAEAKRSHARSGADSRDGKTDPRPDAERPKRTDDD
jgi:hypothetical protein